MLLAFCIKTRSSVAVAVGNTTVGVPVKKPSYPKAVAPEMSK